MMPKMNGWQVLDIILGNIKWRNIPVFFITGADSEEFKKHAEELGITYIEKPFIIEDLKKEIDSYFKNNQNNLKNQG